MAQGMVTFSGVWLHAAADPGGTSRQFRYDPGRSEDLNLEAALLQFAGRSRPVAEFGDQAEHRIQAKLQLRQGSGDLAALQALVDRRGVVCYRDGRGRKVFGVLTTLPVEDTHYGQMATLDLVEVAYTEAV